MKLLIIESRYISSSKYKDWLIFHNLNWNLPSESSLPRIWNASPSEKTLQPPLCIVSFRNCAYPWSFFPLRRLVSIMQPAATTQCGRIESWHPRRRLFNSIGKIPFENLCRDQMKKQAQLYRIILSCPTTLNIIV